MSAETVKVVILAVLQGVTEILPVSSSGHLVLGKTLLKLDSPGAGLEAVLHAGSLLAILVYYRVRLSALIIGVFSGIGSARRDAVALAIGCIPAVLCGVLFEARIESAFDSPRLVGLCLMGTGVILLLPAILNPRVKPGRLSIRQAVAVGLAQVLALLPGISRSGTTITAGRLTGAEGGESASFSFLMAIPLLAGAFGLTLMKAGKADEAFAIAPANLALGLAVAAVVGYAAMAALNRLLASNRLWWFGPYCLLAGLVTILTTRG